MSLINEKLTYYLDLLPNELIIIIMKYLKEKSVHLSRVNDHYTKIYNEFTDNIRNGSYSLNEIFSSYTHISNGHAYRDMIRSIENYQIIINDQLYNKPEEFDEVNKLLEKFYSALSGGTGSFSPTSGEKDKMNKCYLKACGQSFKCGRYEPQRYKHTSDTQYYLSKEYFFLLFEDLNGNYFCMESLRDSKKIIIDIYDTRKIFWMKISPTVKTLLFIQKGYHGLINEKSISYLERIDYSLKDDYIKHYARILGIN